MELWIKTNSKMGFGLVKVNDIVLYSREGMYTLESKDFVLGMYDTKERAIEVLDEIEKFIESLFESAIEIPAPIFNMPKE